MDNLLIKTLVGSNIEINEFEYNRTPGLLKVFTDTKYETAKSMSDMEKVVFRDILQKTNYNAYKPGKGKLSGRDRYILSMSLIMRSEEF